MTTLEACVFVPVGECLCPFSQLTELNFIVFKLIVRTRFATFALLFYSIRWQWQARPKLDQPEPELRSLWPSSHDPYGPEIHIFVLSCSPFAVFTDDVVPKPFNWKGTW